MNQEKFEELDKKIKSLTKERDIVKYAIIKDELTKNKYRFFDFGDSKYWVKVLDVRENECETIEVFIDFLDNHIRIERGINNVNWLLYGIPIVEEIFNENYQKYLDKLKE